MRPNCCSPDPEDENGVREEPVAIWSNKIRSGIRAVASAVEERNLDQDITIATGDSLRKQAMQGPSRTRSLQLTGGVSLADPCAREDCARVYSSAGGVPRCPVRRVVMTQSGEAPSFKEVSILFSDNRCYQYQDAAMTDTQLRTTIDLRQGAQSALAPAHRC